MEFVREVPFTTPITLHELHFYNPTGALYGLYSSSSSSSSSSLVGVASFNTSSFQLVTTTALVGIPGCSSIRPASSPLLSALAATTSPTLYALVLCDGGSAVNLIGIDAFRGQVVSVAAVDGPNSSTFLSLVYLDHVS